MTISDLATCYKYPVYSCHQRCNKVLNFYQILEGTVRNHPEMLLQLVPDLQQLVRFCVFNP